MCACGRMSHAVCMRVWHVNHWTRQPSPFTFSHIPLLSSLPSCPLFSPNIVLSAIRTCSKVLPPRVALLGARAERAPCDYSRARYVLPHLYIPSPHPLPSTVSPSPLRGKRGARLGARASFARVAVQVGFAVQASVRVHSHLGGGRAHASFTLSPPPSLVPYLNTNTPLPPSSPVVLLPHLHLYTSPILLQTSLFSSLTLL